MNVIVMTQIRKRLFWGGVLLGATMANLGWSADMTPLALTGFNRDVVIESTASGPPYSDYAQRVNPTENNVFYQAGLSGKSYGLPSDGSFVSAVGDGTTFQFESYTANNALVLSSDTGLTEGTLALPAPATLGRIAVVAHSASGGGSASVTLNFADGTSFATTYNAPDWFNQPGFALQGTERIDLISGNTSGGATNPRFYQTSFDLVALLGSGNKPIASITFGKVASAGATAVYAVSGEIAPEAPATVLVNPTNTTVWESTAASFYAVAGGVPAPRLQWLRNGAPISGATNSSHTFIAALADHNATYRLVASNFATSVSSVVTSAPATLTVIADTIRPVLLSAQSQGLLQVLVNYSERVTPTSATNLANYALTGPGGAVVISSAIFQSGASNVVLNVPALTEGATYTLTASNVADQSAAANTITNNSTAQFIAGIYTTTAIGSATPAGSQVSVGNGLNLSGGGSDIGGTNDAFQFSHLPRTGDFDVKVRLDSLSLADAWSEAGLLARETLTPGSRSVSVLATPSVSGCYFQARTAINGASTISGSFPVNYPHTWLRLRRVGNQVTGYAGFDGENWTSLGTASPALPATIYLGFAVASHNTNQTATAAFRDFTDVTTTGSNATLPREAPGQSSRNTPVVISEIMYHPASGLLEFVELFNSRGEPEDLSGYQLDGNIQFTFPPGTVIPGGGFLVVAQAPAELEAAHGISGVLGPFAGNLPNSSGTVQLRHRTGATFLEVNYSDQPPWPLAADGAGHSLILTRPSRGEGDPRAWTASDAIGGSPGRLDSISPEPLRGVVINEFLAHTDLPLTDYLELYNATDTPRDLSGAWLSDSVSTNKYQIPPGTTIPARGFLVFSDSTLGFALTAAGEEILLVNSNQTRVIDAIRFGPQENAVSVGRIPDGAADWYRQATRTPGTNNSPALIPPVVINEIMYHPISNLDDDQYVELHNWTANPIDLTDWRLEDGISFILPAGTIIPAQGYLVVAKNTLQLRANYPNLTPANCVGDFGGRLSFSGERIALAKPDYDFVTNEFQIITNISHIVVQEVTYADSGRWSPWADGGGSSLELVQPQANPRLAANWADSDETGKAPWTVISYTGVLDQGTVAADQLQVLLQDAGECLIDDVEVLDAGNNNRIANSTFQSDATGWTAEGAQSASGWETGEGYNSSRSYRVRAATGGDNQINRLRTPLTSNLSSGLTATLRAKARWLRGSPHLLLRLRGNWLDVGTRLTLPTNLGSPGLPNSRLVNNAPPAISDVSHSPILPAANEAVVVSARVNDPNGMALVQLKYRVDPNETYTTVTMTNHHGIYRVTIPGQNSGTLVAFVVTATDALATTSQFPATAPTRECLVRFGETIPTGNLPVYLVWMTQATFNHWSTRLKLDNTPLDVTFVLGNHRAIYNADANYVGSPYISGGYNNPAGNRCGYRIQFGGDDAFLGDKDLVLDWPGGHGNESTGVQEQMAYWIADQMDLPYSYRYFIRLQVNGVTDMQRGGVFEAINKPRRQFIETWYPDDSDGDFYKIERAFEFNDSGGRVADPMPRLEVFTTPDLATGGIKKKLEKYRWTFMKRASSPPDDYSNLFALADALWSASPEPYTAATDGLVDIEQWSGLLAFERIIMNFDSWGHEIGKNMYAYKPQNGKWQLFAYDLDWLMLVAQNRAGVEALFTPVEDPTVARLFAHPPFRRAYYRAIQKAVAGPLQNAIADPLMDVKYQSLVKNGITLCDGQPLTTPTAVKAWFNNRRTYLQNQLAAVAAPFTAVAPHPVTNGVTQISGAAPIQVATIAINGVPWQVRWTGVNTWIAIVPLQPGSNLFQVTGLDVDGNPIPGATGNVSVNYIDPVPAPENHIVINEIQYLPTLPGAQFVELFNTSSNHTFDLSGWQFNGLGYTFPGGALLAPRSYLVLTKDRTPFINSYGPQPLVFDTYGGNLQAGGETLSLLQPTTNPDEPLAVDRVRYEAAVPWPVITNGASLQLRDAAQDNSRVANWTAILTPPQPPAITTVLEFTNVWRFMQVSNLDAVNWTVPAFNDATWPAGPGLLAFENNAGITPLINTVLKSPTIATNGMGSGHAYYFRTTFNFAHDPADFTFAAAAHIDDGAVIYVNGVETTRIRMPEGTIVNTTLTQGGQQPPSGDAINPDLFTLPANLFVTGANVIAVSVHQNVAGSSDITFGLKLEANYNGSSGDTLALATPGAENSVITNLPAFPRLWLNEVQADNQTGPVDNFGQPDPWVELYNPSLNAISLTGYFLSDSYTNLAKWSFPAGMAIPAGGFLVVWCDNEPAQTVAGIPHTNFRLNSGAGRVALSRLVGGTNQIVDYLNYETLPANWSYGAVPDGQPFYRDNLFYVTPGATNNNASPPITIFINEWLADNAGTLADPADGNFEDWFELYNPGTNAVDLGGYFLTDNLSIPNKFAIPNNGHYVVPAGGYLLVWADNEANQNSTNRGDLHVNFALSKDGEALGLFAADGTQIDAVTFGPQTTDVTEGRFPNGAANIFTMPNPTPRAVNVLANTPPILAPIANQEITRGQTLAITANASDNDLPAQTLTFSLGAGAPAGATITPGTGQFSWQPTTAPANVSVSVIVADNGTPSLTTTQTFNVTVYLPPTISTLVNGDQMQLTWPRGTLQEADEVTGPYVDVTTNSPLTVDLTETKKFYRIKL
jgi:hypothetical protein